jgi:hypothetical protein
VYDRYDRGDSEFDLPSQVTTYALPVGIRYFSSSGIFAGAGVSFVRQEVERNATRVCQKAMTTSTSSTD